MSIWRRFPTLLIGRRNLTRTKARSALATLGIVIGVIAIASLGVFGTALQASVTGSLGDIGNQLVVSPGEDADHLSDRDVRTIRRVSGDAGVVPVRQGFARVSYRSESQQASVYGMDDPGETYDARDGNIPSPFRSDALVGAGLAEELDLRVGSSIAVGNRTYRVRAILERQQVFSTVSPDNAVIVPTEEVEGEGYSQVIVQAESGQAANESAVRIRESLNDREERVSIFELGSIVDQIGAVFDAVNLFLIGIGSISLVVAGVSILNVMLMSAIERREEIGVLRAVGYQRRDVLKIMLSEAMLLGVMGGFVGMLFSLAAGLVIYHFIVGNALAVFSVDNALYIGAALAFGVLTAVLSGLYPAYKAANERPVDALRK